jgi:hypothetical protein
MRKYRAPFDDVAPTHLNAWSALFGESTLVISQEELNKLYHDRFKAILVHKKTKKPANNRYAYIEFDSKEDYVLWMLEWS